MQTLKTIIVLICLKCVCAYFTLPGECPKDVTLKDDFNLAAFEGPWYQAYHYSSDGQTLSNCSMVEVLSNPRGIFVNYSRIDRGLFHRYSIGKLELNKVKYNRMNTDSPLLKVKFYFENAPRRLRERKYEFSVLATNYKHYATAYTCQYSPLINKHYIHVWILSRHSILNDVSKELALKPLSQIGVEPGNVIKDNWDKCEPKYYEDRETEPVTFRYAVPI
ncbi:insecticyanin-A-like [Battus philenor]|uniref:insecticyanin-A-like n=1 Tax=Battus philenor TaxID=42288 RepID=UPI0035D080FD